MARVQTQRLRRGHDESLLTLGGAQSWINNAGTTLTVGGAVGDGAQVYGLTKAGAGTLRLTGNNTSDTVLLAFFSGSPAAAGKWGRLNSIAQLGADHESSQITGDGLLNVPGGMAPAGTWYWDGPNVGDTGNGASAGGAGIWSTSNANWDQGYVSRKGWNNTKENGLICGMKPVWWG